MQWLLPKLWTSSIRQCAQYCTGAPPRPSNGKESWSVFCRRFICCCPGGCWGNTEQVVAQWQHPVVSGKALDILHQPMCTLLHLCLRMAIKMANNGGAFVCHCCLFCMITRNYKTMLWSIKANAELQYQSYRFN